MKNTQKDDLKEPLWTERPQVQEKTMLSSTGCDYKAGVTKKLDKYTK